MELLDFVRLRWKVLVLLLLLGFAGIVIAGLNSGGGDYTARTQLLVRPPSSEQSLYGGDPSRYVNTEMRLLYLDDVIEPAAAKGGVTKATLARSLSFQTSGGEVVTLAVANPSPAKAVELVNDVAEAYLSDSKSRALASSKTSKADINELIDSTMKSLTNAQQEVQREYAAALADNPDQPNQAQQAIPASDTTRVNSLIGQLNSLNTQKIQATLNTPTTNSQVLREASGAVQPAGWGPTTYLAGFVGWLLVLLALAGVAVVLSRRVLGVTRWDNAAGDLALGRAIDLHRPPFSPKKQGLNRIANAIRRDAGTGARVLVSTFPESTPALTRSLSMVEDRLAQSDVQLVRADSLPEAVETRPGDKGAGPVLLLVDVALCTLDDVDSFGDYSEAVQRRIVPVLV